MSGTRRALIIAGVIGALVALIAGCAETPAVLRYSPRPESAGKKLLWPPAPDVPRYLFSGELTGENNFVREGEKTKQGLTRLFEWIVGLISGEAPPVVLQRPQAGVTDENGRVYVTDVSRQAVFVFDEKQGQLLVWEWATKTARFVAPIGIALGARDEILVADAELGMVVRLDHDGKPLGSFGKGALARPTGLARDPKQGLVYVADTRASNVKVFDDAGRLVNIIGHPGDQDGELNAPTHLAFADGQLYVTDTLNNRIQIYNGSGDLVGRFGRRGLYVGNLVRPKGVAVDNEGHIYVIESYFDHLLVFNKNGELLMSIGGSGAGPGQFYLPAGVWVDSRNRVFVADMFNGRVQVFQFLGES